jgi:hypothetical protein
MRIRVVCLIQALLLLSLSEIHAQDSASASPRYELVYTPTAAEAATLYQRAISGVSQADPHCSMLPDGAPAFTLPPDGKCSFAPPFPVAGVADLPPSVVAVYSWAPASEPADKDSTLQVWQSSADDRKLSHCVDNICQIFVRALTRNPDEVVLAQCKALSVDERPSGAPWDCVAVAILTKQSSWIKVVTGLTGVQSRDLGLPAFDLAVVGKTLPDVPSFFASIESALTSSPLMLTAKLNARAPQFATLFGTSQYVASKVLEAYRPRLRETATVQVEGFEQNAGGVSAIRISVSTNLLINSLASTNPEDWHRPNPSQEEDYRKAVEANLKKSLEIGCKAPVWRSTEVLTCDLPPAFTLPLWAVR